MYNAKTTFTGYKLGLQNPHLYIGVPDKYWPGDKVTVIFDNIAKDFIRADIETTRTFNDKFRPGETYSLYYVMWKAVEAEPGKNQEPEVKQERLF